MSDIKALLREAAAEIRASVEAEYGHGLEYPSYSPKYDAGMELPVQLEAAAESMGEPRAWLHESRPDSDVITDAVKHVWKQVPVVGREAAYSIPLYLAPPPAVPDALTIEGAIGGAYIMDDGRQFWIDAAVAKEMTARVLATTKEQGHE